MSAITIVILIFSLLGALDKILGNRFGLGKEFERGFHLFAPMAFSMIGMIIISPWIAQLLSPAFDVFYNAFYNYNKKSSEPLYLLHGVAVNDYVQFSCEE